MQEYSQKVRDSLIFPFLPFTPTLTLLTDTMANGITNVIILQH